jgi:hypothetical protein
MMISERRKSVGRAKYAPLAVGIKVDSDRHILWFGTRVFGVEARFVYPGSAINIHREK